MISNGKTIEFISNFANGNIERRTKALYIGKIIDFINGYYLVEVIKNGKKLYKECVFKSEIVRIVEG